MIINKSGVVIRMSVEELRTMGRATQGVKLINLRNGDSIAAVAKVTAMDEEEILEGEEGAEGAVEEAEGNPPSNNEESSDDNSGDETTTNPEDEA